MSQDYYSILGINRNSTIDEIKKAYRKLAHQYHPDKNPNNKDAEAKFKEINNAYQTLSDPQKRKQYDTFGSSAESFGGFNQNYQSNNSNVEFDFNFGGNSNFEDLSDVFETFFGSGFGNSNRRNKNTSTRTRGIDLEMEINISLEEVATGIEKEIKLNRKVKCEHCKGEGYEPGTGYKSCYTCKGGGRVYQRVQTFFGVMQQEAICPTCEGVGKIYEKSCTICKGKTYQVNKDKFTVKIPAGVDNGDKIRVSGKGEVGYRGSQYGDLFLKINVLKHKSLIRENNDIFSTINLEYLDLVLGKKVIVYTVYGDFEMTIPPLTSPETKLRIKGKGIPKLNSYNSIGDHYVSLKVRMPEKISKDQQEILQNLRSQLH